MNFLHQSFQNLSTDRYTDKQTNRHTYTTEIIILRRFRVLNNSLYVDRDTGRVQ